MRKAADTSDVPRTPFRVMCETCNFIWPAFYMPMSLKNIAKFADVICPMCASGKVMAVTAPANAADKPSAEHPA